MLNNKTVLITGGTGSLGKALTYYILNNYPDIKKLIILSRDELGVKPLYYYSDQKKIFFALFCFIQCDPKHRQGEKPSLLP